MNRMFVQNMPIIHAKAESNRVCSGCVVSSRIMYTAGIIVVGKEAIMPPVAPPNVSIRYAKAIAITNATPEDTNNFTKFISAFIVFGRGVSWQLIDRVFKLPH